MILNEDQYERKIHFSIKQLHNILELFFFPTFIFDQDEECERYFKLK